MTTTAIMAAALLTIGAQTQSNTDKLRIKTLRSFKHVQVVVLWVKSDTQAVQVKTSDVEAHVKAVLRRNGIKTLTTNERRRSKGLWLLIRVRVLSHAFAVELSLNPTVPHKSGSDAEAFGAPGWEIAWSGGHSNNVKKVLEGVDGIVQQLCDDNKWARSN